MNTNLRKQIESYIKKHRINQYRLSVMANVNPAIISRYLSGKRSLSWKSAEKLIKIVG